MGTGIADANAMLSRTIRALRLLILVAGGLIWARPASAEDKVEVLVTPKGKPWSVGDQGGWECDPTCKLLLPPDKYVVTMNDAKETLFIRVPTALTLEPGAPKLRKIAGWTALGVFVGAGIIGAIGIYGIAKSCSDSGGTNCVSSTTDLKISKTAAEVLIATAAGLVSISVASATVFALSGDGIRVRELTAAPDPPRRKSFDVMVTPSPNGASLSFVKRF
jgi:hypothetical protein